MKVGDYVILPDSLEAFNKVNMGGGAEQMLGQKVRITKISDLIIEFSFPAYDGTMYDKWWIYTYMVKLIPHQLDFAFEEA